MHLSLVLSKAITPTKSLVADITLQTKGTSMGLAMAVQILPTWEHWSTIFALEISRVIMHLLLMTISMSSMFKVSFAHLTCIAPWASHNKPVLDSCLFEKRVQKCTDGATQNQHNVYFPLSQVEWTVLSSYQAKSQQLLFLSMSQYGFV